MDQKRLPAILLLLAGGCVPAFAAEVTLETYARGKAVPVYTVVNAGSGIPLESIDQTNNMKEGDKVLALSGKGLRSLEGIAKLRVMDQGRAGALGEVKNLHVFLNDNALSSLPAEFFQMQNVKFVYMFHNRFDDIPPEIARMKGLEGMYFTGNRLKRIQPAVFTMTWLRKLQVSENHITELPEAIGNLTELIHFNISHNDIAVLPESIARLTKLRVCDLSDNRITELPEGFGHVPILHQLRVRNDPLTALPAGFEEMPGSIDITGTKIEMARLSPKLRARIGTEKRNHGVTLEEYRQRQ